MAQTQRSKALHGAHFRWSQAKTRMNNSRRAAFASHSLCPVDSFNINGFFLSAKRIPFNHWSLIRSHLVNSSPDTIDSELTYRIWIGRFEVYFDLIIYLLIRFVKASDARHLAADSFREIHLISFSIYLIRMGQRAPLTLFLCQFFSCCSTTDTHIHTHSARNQSSVSPGVFQNRNNPINAIDQY